AIATANDELNRAAHLVELNTKIAEHLGGNTLSLTDKPEQQVLSADVVVVKALSLLLRKLQDFSRPLGEFVEAISHCGYTPLSGGAQSAARMLRHPSALSITLDGTEADLVWPTTSGRPHVVTKRS